ncbi:hypothetical protein KSF_004910 [Reticulibacter mediterranei]|uniref:Uncharacterized protein n=1 Tax=Reticulibacter mediterranei TaxID=2778369 RepID=A0A8J3MZG9_9CHLR|nr:hypothetical protein KSF_004910 [Reticulibacter mediterranei]
MALLGEEGRTDYLAWLNKHMKLLPASDSLRTVVRAAMRDGCVSRLSWRDLLTWQEWGYPLWGLRLLTPLIPSAPHRLSQLSWLG